MKVIKIIFSLIFILPLCGCNFIIGNEPNNVAFVVAVGFDKGKTSDYEITIQFARVTQISGGGGEEGGKGGSEIIQNVTVEAPDLYSAINTANHIVSKKFSLSHAKLIVFSSELAREGVGSIVNSVIRSEEIRPDIFMAVAKESARGYLDEVKPTVEVNPAKYYQLIYSESDSGGIPKTNLQKFYFDMNTRVNNSVLPLAGVAKGGEGEDNSEHEKAPMNEGGFEYRVKNYTAGEVAVNGENKSEAMGMAVFEKDKMIGTLGSVESELYNLMSGNIRRSYISFRVQDYKLPVVVKIYERRSPRIRVDTKEKKILIRFSLESDLLSQPVEGFDSKYLEEQITKEISNACKNLIIKARDELNCDILGLEDEIKMKFLTIKELDEFEFNLKDYEIEIETTFSIRRNGMKL